MGEVIRIWSVRAREGPVAGGCGGGRAECYALEMIFGVGDLRLGTLRVGRDFKRGISGFGGWVRAEERECVGSGLRLCFRSWCRAWEGLGGLVECR